MPTPTIHYGFAPSGERGRAVDNHVRRVLADSLEHILEQSIGHIHCDAPAINTLVANLRRGDRYPPAVFGIYAEIAIALLEGRNQNAEVLLADLVRIAPLDTSQRLLTLGDTDIEEHTQRYRSLMDTDPYASFAMLRPPDAMAQDFRARFERVYQMMTHLLPELAAEFDALVSEIIMVVGEQGAAFEFDGGSSYMLWGGLFINVSSHDSDISMIEVLAHESAHILLYGYSTEEALVENADDELYASPLRTDLRPMDGIYHATYVSVRVHWAMSRLLETTALDPEARLTAERAREGYKKSFAAGYAVVASHGRLTQTGTAVMREAKAYMDAVA